MNCKFSSLVGVICLGLLGSSATVAADGDPLVQAGAAYAEDAKVDGAKLQVFEADQSDYQTQIVFAPAKAVKNFKVLALEFKDAKDDDIFFATKELITVDTVSSEKPFLVKLSFIGSIPNYGVSFEDEQGNLHYFTLSESGEDGSLVMASFKVAK